MYNFYEFFAGGGMARAGFGKQWNCLFANDFDHKKGRAYRDNWGDLELKIADVKELVTEDLPGIADVIWASFPCQDLSLAGGGAGLKGHRSGTFWPFWDVVKGLILDNRKPSIIALENVCGTLTSHGGNDFVAICHAFEQSNYSFGAVIVDASLFVPQSRARLFVVGVNKDLVVPQHLIGGAPHPVWHTTALKTAYSQLSEQSKEKWIWWNLPCSPRRTTRFADLVEEDAVVDSWHTPIETQRLLSMMSDVNRKKIEDAQRIKRPLVGTIYKRTRLDEAGMKAQRAEVRFDDLAGCLRTPAGGSSRQVVIVVDGTSVKSRLISSRETARLMGLPDSYKLPEKYNEAYHLTGDGVVVPVVRHLASHILEPVLDNRQLTYLGKAA